MELSGLLAVGLSASRAVAVSTQTMRSMAARAHALIRFLYVSHLSS
jgi:hypothetical protein